MPALADSPFAILSFLAAPAILTNACTVLALGTSNRLARAADRARLLSNQLLGGERPNGDLSPAAALQLKDFHHAIIRAKSLIRALRCFYFAAGSFGIGTCVSLVGATCSYFDITPIVVAAMLLAVGAALAGVSAVVGGAAILVAETRVGLRVLNDEEEAIETWRTSPPR